MFLRKIVIATLTVYHLRQANRVLKYLSKWIMRFRFIFLFTVDGKSNAQTLVAEEIVEGNDVSLCFSREHLRSSQSSAELKKIERRGILLAVAFLSSTVSLRSPM